LKVWKNGKILILEATSAGGKTWTEIRKETGLSRPVVSEHLKSLLKDELIMSSPGSQRGSKYEITPKGRDFLLRQEDRKFDDETAFFRGYDLESYLLKRGWVTKSSERVGDKSRETRFYAEPVDTPEQLLEREYPVFPLPIRAALRMSDNATYAVRPWFDHEAWHRGMLRKDEKGELHPIFEEEKLFKEMTYRFADPTIRKFCEVVFERTRVLCGLYSSGEKKSLPTLDNILNFNIEVLFRYEGETLLNSLPKEERTKAEHLLAGTLLLYLGGSGKGPVETFVWEKQDLEALIESRLLTREEIQPLLDACELVHFGNPPIEGRSAVQLDEGKLTDEQKRNLTISAYRRFYLADHENYDKLFADAVPAEIVPGQRIPDTIQIVEEREVEEWKNTDVDEKTTKGF